MTTDINPASSSLFAGDDDHTTPLLSSTDPLLQLQDQEESGLSRIIRQSANGDRTTPPTNHLADVLRFETELAPISSRSAYSPDPRSEGQVSLVVIVAGTCALLQIGWIWGSYLSSTSWSDTYLRFTLFQHDNDTLIRTTDLGSLISMFYSTKLYTGMALVVATAVILPCLSMLVTPLWIFEYYSRYYYQMGQQQHDDEHHGIATSIQQTRFTRSLFESTLRFSFLVVFVLALLDLSSIPISLQWTDTNITIRNQMQLGFIFYVLGVTATLGVVVTLRNVGANHTMVQDSNRGDSSNCNNHLLAPPRSAFQYPWTGDSTYKYHAPLPTPSSQQPDTNTPTLTPNMVDGSPTRQQARQRHTPVSARRDIGRWRRCLVWETGLISTVLLVTSFTLPLFQLNYSGLASEFMTVTQVNLYLWQIPPWLWTASDSPTWMSVISVGGLVLYVMILPMVVLACGVAAWMTSSRKASTSYRTWLYSLAPTANTITFVAAMLVIVPSLGPLMDYLLQQQDSTGLCQKFKNISGEACLIVNGRILLGTWSLLAHALALEFFVMLTLGYAQ